MTMTPSSAPVMDLLSEHVPLTLLIDLLPAQGPHSEEIYADEGGDAAWLPPLLRAVSAA